MNNGYIPCPDELIAEYNITIAAVYGTVWRYSQMDKKHCEASNQAIADAVGITEKYVRTCIKKLVEDGYIIDHTPGVRNVPHILTCTDKIKIGRDSEDTARPELSTDQAGVGKYSVPANNNEVGTQFPKGRYSVPERSVLSSDEYSINKESNINTTTNARPELSTDQQEIVLKEIDLICKENFYDPDINTRFRKRLMSDIAEFGLIEMHEALELTISPERANGKRKSYGYTVAILRSNKYGQTCTHSSQQRPADQAQNRNRQSKAADQTQAPNGHNGNGTGVLGSYYYEQSYRLANPPIDWES